MPSENVVKWYGGVVQVAPASEVKYIVPAFQCSQLRQLLWQNSSPGRCGVTFADCCCGSRDVAASHSHTAVAAAETLRRHILRLLLRQQGRCGVTVRRLLLRHCDVTFAMTAVAPETSRLVSGVIEQSSCASCCAYSRVVLWPKVVLRKPEEECCVLPVVQLLFLRLVGLFVACDPRCKSERVGSSRSNV